MRTARGAPWGCICMCGCVKRSTEIIYTGAPRVDISHPRRSLCFSAVYEIISPGDTPAPVCFESHNSEAKLNPIKCVKILHQW